MFANDRSLLALEPSLFRDVAWAGQRLVSGVGSVAGETLTLSTYDVDLAQGGIGAGHVALVDSIAYEVVERLSATTATLSRLRADPAGSILRPSPAAGKPVSVVTFGPQLAIAHASVRSMLGLGADGLDDASVTNPEDLVALEAALALHLVYAGAAALAPRDAGLGVRAEFYAERFERERGRAAALIDTDGNGIADATRRPHVAAMRRG